MLKNFPLFNHITFNDPASPIAEGIIDLHHSIFFYLLLILFTVLYMFYDIFLKSSHTWTYPTKEHMNIFRKNYLLLNNLVHGTILEIVWTITPSVILMLIAMPSFALLYSIDEVIDPKFTIKVIGHQWYWSYETHEDRNFDSYMKPLSELENGDLRLLEVDRPLKCPVNTHLRFIVTSSDVLHSFAIPSLGIKVDAVPGRLNQVSTLIKQEGRYLGQCSELCGVNHGFMPIKILVIGEQLPMHIKINEMISHKDFWDKMGMTDEMRDYNMIDGMMDTDENGENGENGENENNHFKNGMNHLFDWFQNQIHEFDDPKKYKHEPGAVTCEDFNIAIDDKPIYVNVQYNKADMDSTFEKVYTAMKVDYAPNVKAFLKAYVVTDISYNGMTPGHVIAGLEKEHGVKLEDVKTLASSIEIRMKEYAMCAAKLCKTCCYKGSERPPIEQITWQQATTLQDHHPFPEIAKKNLEASARANAPDIKGKKPEVVPPVSPTKVYEIPKDEGGPSNRKGRNP